MSTLTVSIVALVVFVVGAVVMFNLWQGRGSRRLGRRRDRVGEDDGDERAESSGRALDTSASAARGGSASRDSHVVSGGTRRPQVDPGAWTRERREPTLGSDDDTLPVDGPPGEVPDSPRDAGHHTGVARVSGVPAGAPSRGDSAQGRDIDSDIYRGSDRAIDPADRLPDEDLGPPEFEDPRLDPIPPEPIKRDRPAPGTKQATTHPTTQSTPHVAPVFVDTAASEEAAADARDGASHPASFAAATPGSPPAADPDAAAHVPPYVPADVDHAVTLVPRAPVNAERLIALTSSLRHVGSKVVRIEVAGGQGRWLPLQSGVMVGRLRCSVLLANRQGPLNAVELSDFTAAVESLARHIGAEFAAPDMNQVLRRARDLDAVAARLDTQVDLGVEASAPIPTQKLVSVARRLDLVDKGGRYVCFAGAGAGGSGDLLFTLTAGETSDMLAFVLDVPRTAEEHDPWRTMVACASSCAKLTGGRVVDSAGRGMSVALIDNVGLQIEKRYRELADAGLKAGSPAALRVFN